MARLIVCLLFCLLSSRGNTCSCAGQSIEETFNSSEHVFAITVTLVEYIGRGHGETHGLQRAQFRVEEVYKGTSLGFDKILAWVNFFPYGKESHSVNSCDTNGIFPGSSYIIFANSGQELWYQSCGITVQFFRHDVEQLRELAKKKDSTETNGEDEPELNRSHAN